MAGFRYGGGRVLRALRWPSLRRNYRDSWRQRCRASRKLCSAQVCNHFHYWLENVGRSHRCYQLVWYVRSAFLTPRFLSANENMATETGKYYLSRKLGDLSLTFPRWHLSAPMGHVRNDLPFWVHLEYSLCLWDHLDSTDCLLCRFILFWGDLPNSHYLAQTFEVLVFFSFDADANLEQLAHRVLAALYYLWISYILPIVRAYMISNAVLVVIPCALWIASIHVEYPRRLGLIWTALFFGISTNTQRRGIY